jgi:hypothetical protein
MYDWSLRFLGMVAVLTVLLSASAEADAPAGRYTVAAGTVYDMKTKLTWQRAVPASSMYSWADAKTYCQTLGATLDGTGWRLPTIKEIQTIVDESRSFPSIDPTAFPDTPATNFWSSSVSAGSSAGAWFINFGSGVPYFFAMTEMLNVRCVR